MLVLALGLCACGEDEIKTNINAIDATWSGIDVYQIKEAGKLQGLVSAPLFNRDPKTGQIVDGVCKKWKVKGNTITFKLPKDLYYSTGKMVKAKDVKASILHGMKNSPYAFAYSSIENIQVDGQKITLELSSYNSDIEYIFTSPYMCIISKSELNNMTNEELLWSCHPYGMYSVVNYEKGIHVNLERNPKFKGFNIEDSIYTDENIKTMDVVFNVNEEDGVEELQDGNIDGITAITKDSALLLKDNEEICVNRFKTPEINYLELNTKGKLSYRRLRKAIINIINRDELCKDLSDEIYPAYNIISKKVVNHSNTFPKEYKATYANKIKQAKKEMKKLGYKKNKEGFYAKKGKPIELSLLVSDSMISTQVGALLQKQIEDFGIKVKLSAMEYKALKLKLSKDKYDLALETFSWEEPVLVFNNIFGDDQSPAISGKYYDLVKKMQGERKFKKRTKKVKIVEENLAESFVIAPLYGGYGYDVFRKH